MTPKPALETQPLPPAAAASEAYATRHITSAEYNLALRVAALKPIYETIWGAIEVDDVVLMPWPTGKGIGVKKATITNLGRKVVDGQTLILAFYEIEGLRLHKEFKAEEVAFYQSRF